MHSSSFNSPLSLVIVLPLFLRFVYHDLSTVFYNHHIKLKRFIFFIREEINAH